jgi:protein TonB
MEIEMKQYESKISKKDEALMGMLTKKAAFMVLLGVTLAVPSFSGASAVSLKANAASLGSVVEVMGATGTRPDSQPVPTERVSPKYPPRALEISREGWVVVELDIDEYGRPLNPEVVATGESSLFNNSAVSAIKKFRFKPATLDGKAVPVTGKRYKVVYALQ